MRELKIKIPNNLFEKIKSYELDYKEITKNSLKKHTDIIENNLKKEFDKAKKEFRERKTISFKDILKEYRINDL